MALPRTGLTWPRTFRTPTRRCRTPAWGGNSVLICTHSSPWSSFRVSRNAELVEIAASFANITTFCRYHQSMRWSSRIRGRNGVKHLETSFLEDASPVSRPLLIDGGGSALPWHRRGKQNQRRELRQSAYQSPARSSIQILCDFEAYCQIVLTPKAKSFCQINSCETVRWIIQFRAGTQLPSNPWIKGTPFSLNARSHPPSPQPMSITLLIAANRITSGATILADSSDRSPSRE